MSVLSKLCRRCKIINAAAGPYRCNRVWILLLYAAILVIYFHLDMLAIPVIAAYMYLLSRHPGCRLGQARRQSRTSQGSGSSQPTPATSPCPLVSGRSLLRCERSHPSEVRDAPSGQHRGGKEGRRCRFVWGIPSHVLSGRSGVCRTRARRLVTAASRSTKRPQAHARSDGVYRYTVSRPTSPKRSGALSSYSGATGPVGPPPQHRTRPGAQKKTLTANPPPWLPPTMVARYEQLRTDVVLGRPSPEGLGAVIYHGLVDGLALLCRSSERRVVPAPSTSTPRSPVPDQDLLRLLTNMVLQTQSEVMHVY